MKDSNKETNSFQEKGQGLLLILFSAALLIFMFYRPPWEFFAFNFTTNLKQLLINVTAYINYRFFSLLGCGSFAALILIGVFGWARLAKVSYTLKKQRIAYAVAGTILLSLLASTYDLVFGDIVFKSGGWLGKTAIGFVSGFIGTFLTTIIMILLCTFYVLIVFKLKPSDAIREAVKFSGSLMKGAVSIIPVMRRISGQRKNIEPMIPKRTRVKQETPKMADPTENETVDPEKTIIERPSQIDTEKTIIEEHPRKEPKPDDEKNK